MNEDALERLTKNERQVCLLAIQGKSFEEIASELNRSHWTIQNYMRSIGKKFGVTSRTQLLWCIMSDEERESVTARILK